MVIIFCFEECIVIFEVMYIIVVGVKFYLWKLFGYIGLGRFLCIVVCFGWDCLVIWYCFDILVVIYLIFKYRVYCVIYIVVVIYVGLVVIVYCIIFNECFIVVGIVKYEFIVVVVYVKILKIIFVNVFYVMVEISVFIGRIENVIIVG